MLRTVPRVLLPVACVLAGLVAASPASALAPANTNAPSVSTTTNAPAPAGFGTDLPTPAVGDTVTADRGTWLGTQPISYSYQWQRCKNNDSREPIANTCVDIAGANNINHVVSDDDAAFRFATDQTVGAAYAGTSVRVLVTGTNADGAATAISTFSDKVNAYPAFAGTGAVRPALTGTAKEGFTLTFNRGTVSGTPPLTFREIRWGRCDPTQPAQSGTISSLFCGDASENASADLQTYRLRSADINRTFSVNYRILGPGGYGVPYPDQCSSGCGSRNDTLKTALVTQADPGPPVISDPPVVTGTLVDGQRLTTTRGDYTGRSATSYAYQWQLCTAPTGGTCTDLDGQTGSFMDLDSSTVNGYVRSRVIASNGDGASQPNFSARTGQIAPAPVTNTVSPTVSGTPRDGQTLTGARGTWTGTPTITYTYQWVRCTSTCVNINGQTGLSYDLTPADINTTIRFEVTATNAAGSLAVRSGPTANVDAIPPSNSIAPSISGTTTDGQQLTADQGVWSGSPTISYAYRWQRCNTSGGNCSNISGATASTYTLTSAEVNGTVKVVITASNQGGVNTTTATSAASDLVQATPPVNTVLPTLGGASPQRDGGTVTVARGTWTGTPTIAYTYAWQRCDQEGNSCATIPGATSTSYTLTPDDVGQTIRNRVTATNAAGPVEAFTAVGPVVLARPPVNTAVPAAAGSPADRQTLTGDKGTWTGTPTLAYTYQWQRCAASSTNANTATGCVDIPSATASSYPIVTADVKSKLRMVVTATNAGGSVDARWLSAVVRTAPLNAVSSPTITGTAKQGQTLTSSTGTFDGSEPLTYSYQWRRCNADGQGCGNIAGATARTYALVDADVAKVVQVAVTATDVDNQTAFVTSTNTAVIAQADPPTGGPGGEAPTGGGTPTTPTTTTPTTTTPTTPPTTTPTTTPPVPTPTVPVDVPPSIVQGADSDLSKLSGSLVADSACRTVRLNRSTVTTPGGAAGLLKVTLASPKTVTSAAPVQVTVSAGKPSKVKRVTVTVAGLQLRTLKQMKGKTPATGQIRPNQLPAGSVPLSITVTPKKGAQKKLKATLTSSGCTALLTAKVKGKVMTVRVDAAAALQKVTFTLPAGVKASKTAGAITFTTATGVQRAAVVAKGNGALIGRKVTISNPPDKTGIVQVTVPLQKAPKAPAKTAAVALLDGKPSQTLSVEALPKPAKKAAKKKATKKK